MSANIETALTAEDLAKLEKAIASGALRVRFKDHEVTYQSHADMRRAYEFAKRQLAGQTRNRRTVAIYDGGF
jgi:hypothetical protein